jgi:hypothetical protein
MEDVREDRCDGGWADYDRCRWDTQSSVYRVLSEDHIPSV